MNKKFKRNLINILFFLALMFYIFLLSSCGPSKEEVDAWEKHKVDSIAKLEIKTTTISTVYYNAAELGLVPGTISRWAPDNDVDCQEYFNSGETVYIHIIQPDGKIAILPSSKYVWLNLYAGNILK